MQYLPSNKQWGRHDLVAFSIQETPFSSQVCTVVTSKQNPHQKEKLLKKKKTTNEDMTRY